MERLSEQTVGIVGLGRIGRTIAAKLRPFGPAVVACDPYLGADGGSGNGNVVSLVPLEELLRGSDYVVICCPLTPDTFHLIDAQKLALMKRSSYLINTARGRIVDEHALLTFLNDGRIAGAALDVLETEPPALESPLRSMENVIVTPHAAYYSRRAHAQLHYEAAREVGRVLQGLYPRSLVNPEVKLRLRELECELREAVT
jgi:D-3-phosphoglycerate dehydrogenase